MLGSIRQLYGHSTVNRTFSTTFYKKVNIGPKDTSTTILNRIIQESYRKNSSNRVPFKEFKEIMASIPPCFPVGGQGHALTQDEFKKLGNNVAAQLTDGITPNAIKKQLNRKLNIKVQQDIAWDDHNDHKTIVG